MKRILTAAVLIPLVLLAVFKAPNWLFTLLVGAVAILALKEYLDLVEAYGVKPMRWLTYTYVSLLFLAMAHERYFEGRFQGRYAGVLIIVCILLWGFVYLIAMMRRSDLREIFPAAAMSGFGIFYVGLAMMAVSVLQNMGWFPLIFTFFAVWAGDSVAMYTGKAIGRHRMSPRISPNKTWEGAIGSVVGSVVFCGLLNYAAPIIFLEIGIPSFYGNDSFPEGRPLSMAVVVGFAIAINIAAQFGDLVESLIKRGAGVKDSGNLLPGHGGILDRIDALLFAAPVALVIFAFIR